MCKVFFTLCIILFSLAAEANNVTDAIDQLITRQVAQNHNNDFNQINKSYAFVLFYRATCTHCQRFMPVIKQFSDKYGFRVYPYTINGEALPVFPNSMPMTNEIASTFFSSPNFMVPSLFLINIHTMKAFVINQGEESFLDLYAQINQFARTLTNEI